MSEEFIREVDEDLKEEKRMKLWKKLLPYVVSISLGVILSTTGYVLWGNYTQETKRQLGDDFTAAVQLAQDNKKNLFLREQSKTAANKYLYNNLKALKEFEQFLEEAHLAAQSGNKLKDGYKIGF